jgi:hypothetical protein
MSLRLAGVICEASGVLAAMTYVRETSSPETASRAPRLRPDSRAISERFSST